MFKLIAYIDPAAGSILFQIIIAGLLGFFVYIKKIKFFIMRVFRKQSKEELND